MYTHMNIHRDGRGRRRGGDKNKKEKERGKKEK